KRVPQGVNLDGRTLGSVGLGNSVRELFRLAGGLGFGRLVAYSPHATISLDSLSGIEFTSLDTLLREGDFVTINCPLTERTRSMIGARELAMMKPTAYLINTSRGAIVEEAALFAALRDHRIAVAGLDSFETEPAP